MKKGFKITLASALAMSALTPVAAFADETPSEAAATGFYTADSFLTPAQFKALTKAEKSDFLKKENLVLVVAGTVYFAKDALGKSDAELDEIAISEADFEVQYGELSKNGYAPEVVAPGLTVESVSAITTTTVDVAITAPEEDILGATITVLDNNNNKVEVKATDISAGDKVASFTFVTPVEKLEGVWTVDGKEFSFTAIKQLADIMDATKAPLNEVKLLKALNAAGIQNIDDNKLAAYAEAIVDASPETLADVQTAVNEANKTASEGATEAAAVTAVKEATNQIQLLAALEANFDFVNADWIAAYTSGAENTAGQTDSVAGFIVEPVKTDANTTVVEYGKTQAPVTLTFKNIQATINNVNDVQVAAAYDKAFKSLKSADVTAARTLANTYLSVDKDATITTKEAANDSLDVLDALIRVDAATTNNSLKTALIALDNLETALVEKYKNNSINVTVTDDLKIKDVNENLLAAYRTALFDEKDVTKKNQRGDIQTIIAAVNANTTSDLIVAVNDAAKEAVVDADKLVKALNALGLKEVATSNKAIYAAEGAYKTVLDAPAAQALVNIDNVKAITTSTDADKLLVALKVLDLKNVVDANKAAYLADVTGGSATIITNAATIDEALKVINKAASVTVQVKAINEATTATEVKTALDNLAITAYVNVPAADKLFVAESVLKEVNAKRAAEGTAYTVTYAEADATVLAAALGTTGTNGILKAYAVLMGELVSSKSTTEVVAAMTTLGLEGTPGELADAADAYLNGFAKDSTGAVIEYKTLAASKAALVAALAQ